MGQRGRPTARTVWSDDERETLERWARRPRTQQALALRCRIVLAAATGATNQQIARGRQSSGSGRLNGSLAAL